MNEFPDLHDAARGLSSHGGYGRNFRQSRTCRSLFLDETSHGTQIQTVTTARIPLLGWKTR